MQSTNPWVRARLPRSVEEGVEEYMRDIEERVLKGCYKKFWKCYEENNLSDIAQFVQNRIEHHKRVLLNEFNKLTLMPSRIPEKSSSSLVEKWNEGERNLRLALAKLRADKIFHHGVFCFREDLGVVL